jgi:molecular chaperone GrpE
MSEKQKQDQVIDNNQNNQEEHISTDATETMDDMQENEGAQEPSPEDEYEKMKAQYEETKDKYIRLLAEFDNFKKRSVREKMELMRTAAQDTLTALLPVLDDFDRAKKAADANDKGALFEEGIGLVYQKLYSALQQKGLKPMDTDGQPFDPELHEAFTEIPAPNEEMKGHIIDTIEKGYWLNEKIIRHAKVVVGK